MKKQKQKITPQRKAEIEYDQRQKAKGIRNRSFRLSNRQYEVVKEYVQLVKETIE